MVAIFFGELCLDLFQLLHAMSEFFPYGFSFLDASGKGWVGRCHIAGVGIIRRCRHSSRDVLGPSNGGVVKAQFWCVTSFLVLRFPSLLPVGTTAVSPKISLLVSNTGSPEPNGFVFVIEWGVASPHFIPTFMFSTHLLMSELDAISLFEFGQSPEAITEVFRGGHALSVFLGVWLAISALSGDAGEEFAWFACVMRKFCSALDMLSDISSSKNMSVVVFVGVDSTSMLILCQSSISLANGLVVWKLLVSHCTSFDGSGYSHSFKLIFIRSTSTSLLFRSARSFLGFSLTLFLSQIGAKSTKLEAWSTPPLFSN